jgi:hypothetical protein
MARKWEHTFGPGDQVRNRNRSLVSEQASLREYAKRTNELDLHGYTVASARELALEFVKAAWEAGHDHVVLIHGARAAREPRSELVLSGYGGIKWSLRAMLEGNEFDPYARSLRSPLHRREATRLIIALEPHTQR